MNKGLLGVVILLLCTTVLFPQDFFTNDALAEVSNMDSFDLIQSNSLVEISDIAIIDDSVFSFYCSIGNGSVDNPYIIENYHVVSQAHQTGIWVGYTSKHFVIRNCLIENASIGINIDKIANNTALIINNTLVENHLRISNIRHADVRNNSFLGMNSYLSLSFCSFISIINNTFLNSGPTAAIESSHSFNLIIMGNSIQNTIGLGITLNFSYYAVICYNTIINSSSWSIEITSYPEVVFHHNNVINNSIAFGSQARSLHISTTWYDTDKNEGNFWSDWSGSGSYYINNSLVGDLYPFVSEIIFNWTDITIPVFYNISDDQYEHNDLFEDAVPLEINQVYQLNANDDDFFRITLSNWYQLKMTITYNRADVLIDMFLLDTSGESGDSAFAYEYDYIIDYFSLKTEDYIIHISPNRKYLPSPEYTLNITAFTELEDDAYEENDVPINAKRLDSENGIYNLVYADVDVFKISVDIGFTIQADLTTCDQITDLDIYLVLYNETSETTTILAEGVTEISNESVLYRTSKDIVCYLIIQCSSNNGIPLYPFEYTLEVSIYLISRNFPISSSFIFFSLLICSVFIRYCLKKAHSKFT